MDTDEGASLYIHTLLYYSAFKIFRAMAQMFCHWLIRGSDFLFEIEKIEKRLRTEQTHKAAI